MDTQNQKRFKLCVPLVQMTPIYHFQADEAGATLRATEVKPKLDRYLFHAAFHDDPKQFKQYCIATQEDHSQNDKEDANRYALNYRLSISVDDPSALEKVELSKKTINNKVEFIGSIWDSADSPAGTMLKQNATITLHFFSRHSELLDKIDQWIDAFFAGENFGRRQSKGFGSFVTKRSSQKHSDFSKALKAHMLTTVWAEHKELKVPFAMRSGATTWIDALNDIRSIHKVLKSGENRKNPNKPNRSFCISSYLLKEYAKNHSTLKNFDNEKKTIYVSTLKAIDGATLPGRDSLEPPREEKRFFRAMLGLPQFYEFGKIFINNREYVARIKIADPDEEHPSVERFRSPITYKPLRIGNVWRYYLIPVAIPEEMYSHPFKMQMVPADGKKKKQDVLNTGITPPAPISIQTPSAKEFDLLDLLSAFSGGNQQNQVKRTIGYTFDHQDHKTSIDCTFGHITIKKEERPDE